MRRPSPHRGPAKGRDGRLASTVLLCISALGLGACAETVRPVLGGLKIGPQQEGPFVTPVMVVDQTPFAYPEDAWKRGVGGETTLRIHISETGTVDSVAVASSSGDAVLDSAAVAGAWRLRYRPAHRGASPVSVWALLPVQYPMPRPATARDLEPM